MAKKIIPWAGREKKRQTNKAVGGSFLKTVTELVTNSDSAVKKHLGLPHAAGLVDAMLGLKSGDRVDTATLKKSLDRRRDGKIIVEIYSKQCGRLFPSRTCQVIDYGPGMTEKELEFNFGAYAEAKAKGQQTRSLFGRGALDVFLYHSNQRRGDGSEPTAQVFSVKDGTLSRCRIYWGPTERGEEDCHIDTETLGPVTAALLKKFGLPDGLTRSGTVVRFLLAEGTHIPQESNFLPSMSNFYMLRLISADPFMHVLIRRFRSEGWVEDELTYDFPLGTVLARLDDVFQHERLGNIPMAILVARSDEPMTSDSYSYERRESGLLFVDDNDAVLDLTLLPDYDKEPLLRRIYGIVKLTGARTALEKLLEERHPEAVLSETRDGFDMKNEIARALFALVEKHVKPIYTEEIKRERKGGGHRSAELDHRLKDALKELNKFHREETDEPGIGPPPKPEPERLLDFALERVRLVAGQDRRVILYAERDAVHRELNVIEITSSNPRVHVVPETEEVIPRKGSRFQTIPVTLSCAVHGETAIITARAMSTAEEVLEAVLEVTDVIEPQQTLPPDDLEFRPARYNGKPNVENQLVLLVNLSAFTGLPNIKFQIINREGAVSIGTVKTEKLEIKVERTWLMPGGNVAKVVVPYWGTAWGARAEIEAKAKRADGQHAIARCKVRFREERGPDYYENIWYDSLDRKVLGEVAGRNIHVNSNPQLHRQLFGDSQETFDQALEKNEIAQRRVATIISDAVVYAVASTKYQAGGEKGLDLGPDPITGLRTFVEEKRYELEPKMVRAFVREGAGS
ncbi:MAG TPA: hypothetical protein VFA33_04945 [Bryobacteraceae bacterium]|nr:hypothetical protein [Bryobacteraceae bacterium]